MGTPRALCSLSNPLLLLAVLQAAHCQMIKDLSACLLGQNLRVDCRYENKTDNPLTYEFSITKDNRKHVIHSTISVSENIYRSRANVTMHKNLVCLYLQSFTTSDEGIYMCELKATNDYTGNQIKNITVIKGEAGTGTWPQPFPPAPWFGRAGRENHNSLWCPQILPELYKLVQTLTGPSRWALSHRWAHSTPSHTAFPASLGSHLRHIA